jgi:hypothetical protein
VCGPVRDLAAMQRVPRFGLRDARPLSVTSVAPLLPRFATYEGLPLWRRSAPSEIAGTEPVTSKSPAPQ